MAIFCLFIPANFRVERYYNFCVQFIQIYETGRRRRGGSHKVYILLISKNSLVNIGQVCRGYIFVDHTRLYLLCLLFCLLLVFYFFVQPCVYLSFCMLLFSAFPLLLWCGKPFCLNSLCLSYANRALKRQLEAYWSIRQKLFMHSREISCVADNLSMFFSATCE